MGMTNKLQSVTSVSTYVRQWCCQGVSEGLVSAARLLLWGMISVEEKHKLDSDAVSVLATSVNKDKRFNTVSEDEGLWSAHVYTSN